MFILWWFCSQKLKPKMKSFNYLLIFISGAICSYVMYKTINYLSGGDIVFSDKNVKRSKISYMPEKHYLEIRNDYSVQSPSDGTNFLHKDIIEEMAKNEANLQEALGTLKVAVEFKLQGKQDKALRLFDHALALAPKHPEVLTKYGEFLEHHRRDVIRADLMYFQALTANPKHMEALENRQRTANIVEILDRQRLAKLDEKRDALSAIHESNSALRRAKKEAYFQNIYHSVGIEGNTMTLAQTRSILETRMAIDGKSIDEHNEILGLDAAMKYINATLVNRNNDYITLKDILEVHKRVLGNVDPIEGGEFRRTQVYVGGHIPPGPGDLSILMNRFEQWLNSEQTITMHPIKYAALAHYKLVHIHPFTDGNGRTSRLLMNTILMRYGYPPVIIPKQKRHNYYQYLQMANDGDVRPFVRFIADCTDKTLDLFLWATSELSHQIPLLAQDDHAATATINTIDSNNNVVLDNDTVEGSGLFGSDDDITIRLNGARHY